jgi:hypothetical protein
VPGPPISCVANAVIRSSELRAAFLAALPFFSHELPIAGSVGVITCEPSTPAVAVERLRDHADRAIVEVNARDRLEPAVEQRGLADVRGLPRVTEIHRACR